MMPTCPFCDAPVSLSDKPQTKDLFDRNMDSYICRQGHVFEATIPMKVCSCNGSPHGIRADF